MKYNWWEFKRNPEGGGLIIYYRRPGMRTLASYPNIVKWYYKWLWPYAIYKAMQSIRILRDSQWPNIKIESKTVIRNG